MAEERNNKPREYNPSLGEVVDEALRGVRNYFSDGGVKSSLKGFGKLFGYIAAFPFMAPTSYRKLGLGAYSGLEDDDIGYFSSNDYGAAVASSFITGGTAILAGIAVPVGLAIENKIFLPFIPHIVGNAASGAYELYRGARQRLIERREQEEQERAYQKKMGEKEGIGLESKVLQLLQ